MLPHEARFPWHNELTPCERRTYDERRHARRYVHDPEISLRLPEGGGKTPDPTKFSANALQINEKYWTAIVADLVNRKYIRGVTVFHNPDGDTVQVHRPCVTVEGVEFMMENSLMRRALEYIKEAKSAIPFA